MPVSSEPAVRGGRRWPGAAAMAWLLATLIMLLVILSAGADDTDIYRSLYDIESRGAKPQVMILFDTSASMKDVIAGELRHQTKIEIARTVITNLVRDNPQVDFGLAIFNDNYDNAPHGGRVIHSLPGTSSVQDSDARRQALLDMVATLKPVTTTPLCETYYEIFRYFSGRKPWSGNLDRSRNDGNPEYSRDAIAQGSYVSPLRPCEPLYLIYMTDGVPFLDTDANADIRRLLQDQSIDLACRRYPADRAPRGEINCMPELAYYMQRLETFSKGETPRGPVITYTIGFDTDQRLLADTASPLNIEANGVCPTVRQRSTRYHGDDACVGYFTATSAEQLYSAFQVAIDDVLSRSTTFAAPAVSAAFTNNTQSLNRLYLPRFLPRNTPRWSGNVKRLEFVSQQHWKDARGREAFNAQTGDIRQDAYTWWSGREALALGEPDGNEVEAGGVGALLRQTVDHALRASTQGDGRRIVTDDGERLATFGPATGWIGMAANWGLPVETSKTDLESLVAWARGADVDDEDGDGVSHEARPWILGDVLHSDPIVLNYGGVSRQAEKLYLAFGTNAGFLHFVDGDSGQEQWAFMPRALSPLQPLLRANVETASADKTLRHPYGVDGPAAYVRIDADADGRITANSSDKMLLAFGLRRGGRRYYALDVTDPAEPVLAWQLSAGGDFAELGQSWAAPIPARVPGHANPVFVISGGYDPGRDDPERDATQGDSQGRALYIVDALTGELVYRADPTTSGRFIGGETFRHAIPAAPEVVDLDSDGVADRLYLADVGGSLWRLDLAGSKASGWRLRKIAALGGSGSDNRRFFNSVDFVGLEVAGQRQALLLLGSGDRANPKAGGEGSQTAAVNDAFFAVRDPVSVAAASGGRFEPISVDRLTDISDQRFCDREAGSAEVGNDDADTAARACLPAWQSGAGWVLYLDRGYSLPLTGAKVLSPSVTLDGSVYFSAYVPDEPASICVPVVGRSYLFGLDLLTGLGARSAAGSDAKLEKGWRAVEAGEYLLGRPALLVRGGELFLQGIGAAPLSGLMQEGGRGEGGGMKLPYRIRRTYWYEPSP